MDVVHAVHKVAQEQMGRHALPQQVAGVEVQAELGAVGKLLQQLLGGVVVESDLAGMDLQGELDAVGLELIQDRGPQAHDLVVAVLDHLLGGLGEGIQPLPDGRAGEARDHIAAQLLGHHGGLLHGVDRPGADLLRLVGQRRGSKVVQPGIGSVAHTLADDVAGQSLADQVVLRQGLLDPGHVAVIAVRTVNVDAVAPAGDLQAVIAHLGRQRTQFIEGQVRPLAGAKSYRSVSHDTFLLLKS